MIQKNNEIITTIVLTVIFAGLIFFNFVSFQRYNKIVTKRNEIHQALEAQQLEKIAAREATGAKIELRNLIRSQETADIIEFDTWYKETQGLYLDEIRNISEEFDKKVINIEDLKRLVTRRSGAAEDFKNELLALGDIPEPLESLYFLIIDFLDNDIATWNEVLQYYSENFSTENPIIIQDQEIRELYAKNVYLYRQIGELQSEIYTEYGLESLL